MNKFAVKIKRNSVAKVIAQRLDHNKEILNNQIIFHEICSLY